MDVCWPERVPVHQLQQLAGRPIRWNRIRRGANTVERVFTVRIDVEFSPEVVVNLIIILLLIETLGALASTHVAGEGTLGRFDRHSARAGSRSARVRVVLLPTDC
jgi:hypothetical protein